MVTFRPLWQSPSDLCRVSEPKSKQERHHIPVAWKHKKIAFGKNDVDARCCFYHSGKRVASSNYCTFQPLAWTIFCPLLPPLSRWLFFGLINNPVHASEAAMSHAGAADFGPPVQKSSHRTRRPFFLVTSGDCIGDCL